MNVIGYVPDCYGLLADLLTDTLQLDNNIAELGDEMVQVMSQTDQFSMAFYADPLGQIAFG